MTDNTNEMHDQTNTPLELPPTPLVPWDLGSFLSEQSAKNHIKKTVHFFGRWTQHRTKSSMKTLIRQHG